MCFHVYPQVSISCKRLSTVVTCEASLLPMLHFVVPNFTLLGESGKLTINNLELFHSLSPFPTDGALILALPRVPALVDVQLDLGLE